jgi:hypothetical protein
MRCDKRNAHREDELLTAPDPETGNLVVVVLAKHTHAGEGVLAELLNALEHARDEVAGHEGEAELLGVLVRALPD